MAISPSRRQRRRASGARARSKSCVHDPRARVRGHTPRHTWTHTRQHAPRSRDGGRREKDRFLWNGSGELGSGVVLLLLNSGRAHTPPCRTRKLIPACICLRRKHVEHTAYRRLGRGALFGNQRMVLYPIAINRGRWVNGNVHAPWLESSITAVEAMI